MHRSSDNLKQVLRLELKQKSLMAKNHVKKVNRMTYFEKKLQCFLESLTSNAYHSPVQSADYYKKVIFDISA